MSGTDVEPSKPFQEKMFERIRDSIGDLLTDEELAKIVKSGVERAFFEPTRAADSYGYGRGEVTESTLVKLLRQLLQARVDAAVDAWLAAHPVEVEKAIQECIGKGFLGLIINTIDNKISWPLQELATKLREKGILG